MTVAVVLNEGVEPLPILRWAAQFARARKADILVLQSLDASGPPKVTVVPPTAEPREDSLIQAVQACVGPELVWKEPAEPVAADDASGAEIDGEDNGDVRQFHIKKLKGEDLAEILLKEIASASVTLLVLPRPTSMRSTSPAFALERELFRDAHCDTMQLCCGDSTGETCRSILVPAAGGHQTTTALQLATAVADANDGKVTALYVEPYVDAVAELVGQQIIERVVTKALGSNLDRVVTQVVLSNDVTKGINLAREAGHDLVLLGVAHHGVVHRLLFSSISERVMMSEAKQAVAVLRPAIPLASRLRQFFERLAKSGIPQLDRSQRVALVERVQSNSRFDVDFLSLTCLSTLIAALGLVQNSAAVVIGAMLVAPLMTPLLGAGLSLVQGNVILVRNATLSVFRGFVVAFAIGIAVGLLTPNLTATPEMLARGSPRIPDLFVAFISGIAAAYAIGRPNLLSALPGVAIAAALVPPLATAGLATSLGRWGLATGALLLFVTNIVAIVLGAACALWVVGIRSQHEHGGVSGWTRAVSVGLILIAVGLAVDEAWPQYSLPPHLRSAMKQRVDDELDTRCLSLDLDGTGARPQVAVVVAAPAKPGKPLTDDLLRMAAEHYGDGLKFASKPV